MDSTIVLTDATQPLKISRPLTDKVRRKIDRLAPNRANLPKIENLRPLTGLNAKYRDLAEERIRKARHKQYFRHDVMRELLRLADNGRNK